MSSEQSISSISVQTLSQKRLEMGEGDRLKLDHELVDFVYKNQVRAIKYVIAVLIVSFIFLVFMAVFTGMADYADSQTTAGFLGNWVMLSAVAVLGCAAYFGRLVINKGKSPFKDFSAFQIKNTYEDVIKEHVSKSDFAKYVASHPDEQDCVGRALIHIKAEKTPGAQ